MSFNKLFRKPFGPALKILYRPIVKLIPDTNRHYKSQRRLLASLVCITVAILSLITLSAASFMSPRSATFSYSTDTCIYNPVLLPNLARSGASTSFSAKPKATIFIAGYPIFAERICIQMDKASQGSVETIKLSSFLPFVTKKIKLTPGSMAQATRIVEAARPVSVRDPLVFNLDKPDSIYSYRLQAGKASVACSSAQAQQLICDLVPLQLVQASQYEFELQRVFKKEVADTAFKQTLKTVDVVTVTDSSIKPGQQIVDKPAELVITLNREAIATKDITLTRLLEGKIDGKQENLPIVTELKGTELRIRFEQPLPRSADLHITVPSLTAADGGYLPAPYTLDFKTSGGPKVTSTNIGTYNIAPTPSITLRLDNSLNPAQNLTDIVRIEVGGRSVPVSVSGSGATISLRPQQSLGACTTFVIKVLDTLQNIHGVSGGNAWQYQSRTTCQIISSIGTSVQGRPITSYRFGSGSSAILFVGATHGNERSSATLLYRWIDYLEANPGVVPGHRSITIIPVVNPDGYAANTRTNANNVDLNRNFPASNWKQSVAMPDKSTNPNGGGSSPLSEPESRALANYTQSLSPRLVLTYHATGNVAVPNLIGDSNDLAWKYARNSSVYYLSPNSTATFFEYDTTGAYEDWLHDKAGITALLIELNTMTSSEFNAHVPALKIMAGL